jgi:hypothetical protein
MTGPIGRPPTVRHSLRDAGLAEQPAVDLAIMDGAIRKRSGWWMGGRMRNFQRRGGKKMCETQLELGLSSWTGIDHGAGPRLVDSVLSPQHQQRKRGGVV